MLSTSAYTPLAERLRHYSPALASLARALFDARGALHGVVQAAPQAFSPAMRAGRAAQLTIGSGQGALQVQVDAGGHAAFEAIALEPDAARRAALAGLWLATPLAALARHGAAQPAVLELTLAAPPDARTGVLHIAYQHDGATATAAVVEACGALAAALAASIGPQAHRGHGAALDQSLASLTVPTRVRLRSRQATPKLLASLRPGDVLLGWPGAPGFGPHAALEQATLLWGATDGHAVHARARIDSCNITLESLPATMNYDPDLSLATAGAVAAGSANPIDVNDVELPVHIEVVTVNLPIGQIAALQPGFILTLPLSLADAEIRLVAHGQTLAFGELVAIGDQLGLHICRIAKSDERHS